MCWREVEVVVVVNEKEKGTQGAIQSKAASACGQGTSLRWHSLSLASKHHNGGPENIIVSIWTFNKPCGASCSSHVTFCHRTRFKPRVLYLRKDAIMLPELHPYQCP